MISISHTLNTYILPEMQQYSPYWDNYYKITSRPLEEILLDPLRSVIGGKSCCRIWSVPKKPEVFIEKKPEYSKSLASRTIQLMINSQIGISTCFVFFLKLNKKPLGLIAGLVCHIMVKFLFEKLHWHFLQHLDLNLNLANRTVVYFNRESMIFSSLATSASFFAAYCAGMTLKSYICTSIAILVGSVAVGVILKISKWSSVQSQHHFYCQRIQNQTILLFCKRIL